jgi:endonuclease/exonuclease/phosphatase family metal-dependent hydrolase
MEKSQLKVATYNIHKCRGLDQKISPDRIVEVIRQLDADVICLQEVVHAPEGPPQFNQAERIARGLPEYTWAFGGNRSLHGGTYGNMTLSRLSLTEWRNHDLTHQRREERGVLQTDIALADSRLLRIFNVHLGTSFLERRHQGKRMFDTGILSQEAKSHPRLVLGDLNEWTRGLTTRLLRREFETFRPKHIWRFPRTYPGVFPFMTLDHLYFEAPLSLISTALWRSRLAMLASDHLPLTATFEVVD